MADGIMAGRVEHYTASLRCKSKPREERGGLLNGGVLVRLKSEMGGELCEDKAVVYVEGFRRANLGETQRELPDLRIGLSKLNGVRKYHVVGQFPEPEAL